MTSTRARLCSLAFAAACASSVAAPLAAQTPQAPPPVQGWLRDPAGASVAAAEILFVPDAAPELPALASLRAPAPARAGTSEHNGIFKIAAPGPGLVLARSPQGLGAIAPRCQPGRAVPMRLQPMAEIVVGSGSEPFTLWAAFVDDDGEPRRLPLQQGTNVRLPAGLYEAWFEVADGFAWQRLLLVSGQRCELNWSPERLRLTRNGEASVFPTSFPDVPLLGADAPACTLLGSARQASLSARRGSLTLPLASCSEAQRERAVPSPIEASDALVSLTLDLPAQSTAAEAWLLERTLRGGHRLLAHARADEAGRVALPLAAARGDAWLLVTADGCAPLALPATSIRAADHIALHRGRTATARVTTADGQPAVGVVVDFEPADAAPATIRARTDDRGIAMLGPIATIGTLRIEDPRYVAQAVELTGEASRSFVLDLGAAVAGRIETAPGRPASGATITLRDPRDRLRPAERTVAADADGRFRFTGLPPNGAFVLFAAQVHGGATWSARLDAAAGDEACVVTLTHEDPQLRPGGDGR